MKLSLEQSADEASDYLEVY